MSLKNAYDYYNDGNSNVPVGYTVENAYGAYFKSPSLGDKKIAIYGDNFLIGYTGVEPPVRGGYISGRLGIGQIGAETELDVLGSIRTTGFVSVSETAASGALSTRQDTLLDARNLSTNVTLADSSLIDQVKIVRLLTKNSLSRTVVCNRGAFRLTPKDSMRTLRSTNDGWVIEHPTHDSFYPTREVNKVVVELKSYGTGLAITADGTRAAIGASQDNSVGSVRIYYRAPGTNTWTLEQKLVGTGYASEFPSQGGSCAFSADGSVVAFGAVNAGPYIGAVCIFERSGTVWTQKAILVGTGSEGFMINQGNSIALSADGKTLASGGRADDSYAGAVWIFKNSQGSWSQVGNKLVGSGATGNASQGNSVAISADGNTVAWGGVGDDSSVGATWVFQNIDGTYTEQLAANVGTDAIGASNQGISISLSADGDTLAVGGSADDDDAGATWVFTRAGTVWSQQAKLIATSASSDAKQGSQVSLTADGNTLAVFGRSDNQGTGGIWIFTRFGTVWTQQRKLVPSVGYGTGLMTFNANGTCLAFVNGDNSSDEIPGNFIVFS